MTWLSVGLVLWFAAHLFKRMNPAGRALLQERMGDASKGIFAAALLAAVVMMVIGYRAAPFQPVYAPVPGIGHLNNLLMLFALFLFGAGSAKGIVASKLRHPMLWSAVVWAVAHLLVNGDLASLLLFGSLGLWALVQMAAINRAEGPWTPPAPGPVTKDIRALVIGLVMFAIIAGIHIWLGHNPFLGTYG